MTRWCVGLSFLIACVSGTWAQEVETFRRISSQPSPRGTFELVYYQQKEVLKTITEIRLEPLEAGLEEQVLFRGGESTWAFISPDEQWIAVNSAESEKTGYLYLFRRTARMVYEQSKAAQVERRALSALMTSQGRSAPPRFDEFFCYADFWAENSGCLLGHIEGRERGTEASSRFYFVFDPAANRASLDLGVLNRGAFVGSKSP